MNIYIYFISPTGQPAQIKITLWRFSCMYHSTALSRVLLHIYSTVAIALPISIVVYGLV